jgi:Ran GTPase-activating protein (RanGAP) involved in mRNA processing and transport
MNSPNDSPAAPSRVSAVEEVIDDEDQQYLDGLSIHTSVWQGWVNYSDQSNESKQEGTKRRLLMTTMFRIYIIRKSLGGARREVLSFSILDLLTMFADMANPKTNVLTFEFQPNEDISGSTHHKCSIQHTGVSSLAQKIFFAHQAITYGRCTNLIVRVPYLGDYLSPEPDTQDGTIAAYIAQCDKLAILPNRLVIDYFIGCFMLDETKFEFSDCFSQIQHTEKDIEAVCRALQFCDWFRCINCRNFKMGSRGMAAVAAIFTSSEQKNTKLTIINSQCPAKAFLPLFDSISKFSQVGAPTVLTRLDLSRHALGNANVALLVRALEGGIANLAGLSLNRVGITGAGVGPVLNRATALRESLQYLDLACNELSPAGTALVVEYLRGTEPKALRLLNLSSCDLDMNSVLCAMSSPEARQSLENLTTLDLSGNRLDDTKANNALCDLLHDSSVSILKLCGCRISQSAVVRFIDSVFSNKHAAALTLDLSANDLGPKGAGSLKTMFENLTASDLKKFQKKDRLKSLLLNDNNFGHEGLKYICQSFTDKLAVGGLGLDRNIKIGFFSTKAQDVELCSLLSALLSSSVCGLQQLSLAGNGSSHMYRELGSLFDAVASNTRLTSLDISGNRLGETQLAQLCNMLKENTTLTELFLDDNKWQMSDLWELNIALAKNFTMLSMEPPVEDIKLMVRKGKELRILVSQITASITRNNAEADAAKLQNQRSEAEKKNHTMHVRQGSNNAVVQRRRAATQMSRVLDQIFINQVNTSVEGTDADAKKREQEQLEKQERLQKRNQYADVIVEEPDD